MSKSVIVTLLVVATVIWITFLYVTNQTVEYAAIEWFDVVSEIFTLLFILLLLAILLRLNVQQTPTDSPLLISGLVMIFIGHCHDLLDEFVIVEPKIITLFLENIMNNAGLIILALTVLKWSARYRTQVSTLERRAKELAEESYTDPLTQLYNRRFLNQLVMESVETQVVKGDAYSVILIDIDNFKDFNDRFGHIEGDGVIKRCADVIINSSRPNDFAFRFGGEEFLLVINGDFNVAQVVAERIRSSFESICFKPQTGVQVQKTVSLGIVELDTQNSFTESLHLADEALYKAKHQGKNCIVIAG